MIPGSNQIQSLATKYSKPQLQQMAQLGKISPLDAVMAGMLIDRVVLSASKPPESTVADDVFTPKTQVAGVAPGNGVPGNGAQEAPGGAQREIAARTHMPQLAQAPQSAAAISAAHGGLMSIPRPGEKYNQDNFATGGIVAFQQGGMTRDPTEEELAAFQLEVEQARRDNTRQMFAQREYRQNQGPSGGLPQIMGSPQAAVAPAVAAPTSTNQAETQKQLAKVRPAGAAAPVGPLAAMAAPQQAMDAPPAPKRTPADTTGLVDIPESIAKNKKDLMYRTIGYTGAEMMAGKSPFALVNIGEALSKGFSTYAQQIEAHRKTTKDDIKDLATIRRAEQALEQGEYKIAVDMYDNDLKNKNALKVADMQVKGHLDAARIGAEARKFDKTTTPFEAWQKGTPEQRAEIESFVGVGKGKTREELTIAAVTSLKDDYNFQDLTSSKDPKDQIRANKILTDRINLIHTGGVSGGVGGGSIDQNNPLLARK